MGERVGKKRRGRRQGKGGREIEKREGKGRQ
jgi:hypothetical protein